MPSTPLISVTSVISAVTIAAQKANVTWEYADTSWLTYMPQELILTGSFGNIQAVRTALLNTQNVASQRTFRITFPGETQEIHCLTLTPTQPTHTVMNLINWIQGTSSESAGNTGI